MGYRDFMFLEDYYITLNELVNCGKKAEADEILNEIVFYGMTRERTKTSLSSPIAESIFRQCKTRIDISYKRKERKEESLRRPVKKKQKENKESGSINKGTEDEIFY